MTDDRTPPAVIRTALEAAAGEPVAPAWDAIHTRVAAGEVEVVPAPRRRRVAFTAAAALLVAAAVGGAVALTRGGPDQQNVAASSPGGDRTYCDILAAPAWDGVRVQILVAPNATPAQIDAVHAGVAELDGGAHIRIVDEDSGDVDTWPGSVWLSMPDQGAADAAVEELTAVTGTRVALRMARRSTLDAVAYIRFGHDGDGIEPGNLDRLTAAAPAAIETDLGTVTAVLRDPRTPDPTERAAAEAVVTDAASRCDLTPVRIVDPSPVTTAVGDPPG